MILYGFSVDLLTIEPNINKRLEHVSSLREFNDDLYNTTIIYLFNKDNGILNNICPNIIQCFKNGHMYIVYELNETKWYRC